MNGDRKRLQEQILHISKVHPEKCMKCGKCSASCPSYEEMEGRANGHLQALRAKYPNTPMAVILPIWRADYTLTTKKVGSFEDARNLLREAAARVNATVIDGMTLVPHVTEVYADLRLHPTEFGFQFYAENLLPYFKKILEK